MMEQNQDWENIHKYLLLLLEKDDKNAEILIRLLSECWIILEQNVLENQREISNLIKTTLTHRNFKTNPIVYPEVIYKAFGIITPELHIILYGQLQNQYNARNGKESTISDFDNYLFGLPNVRSKIWINPKTGTQYKTLPTFIRNKIDHPEAKMPVTNKTYHYSSDEIKSSIDWISYFKDFARAKLAQSGNPICFNLLSTGRK